MSISTNFIIFLFQDLKQQIGRLTVLTAETANTPPLASLIEKSASNAESHYARIEEGLLRLDLAEKARAAQATSQIPPNLADLLATSIGAIVRKVQILLFNAFWFRNVYSSRQ